MKSLEPTFLLPDVKEADPRAARKRMMMTVAASVVAIGGLSIALVLGTIGYDVRRKNMHEARLKGVLVQTPTVYQVTEGLKEKAPLAQIIESPVELSESLDRWAGSAREEILEKANRYPQLRVFDAGDMIYFIFFDAEHIMRDYVCVSSR